MVREPLFSPHKCTCKNSQRMSRFRPRVPKKVWGSILIVVCIVGLVCLAVQETAGAKLGQNLTRRTSSFGSHRRPITISDLLTIRDCEGISISPNGMYVAFVVGQAVYKTNGYRSNLFVVGTKPGSALVNLGTAGLPHWDDINQWIEEAPQWSSDSRFITYRMRRSPTETWQVWRWNHHGGTPIQLTHVPGDVIDYHWTVDGSRIVMTVQRPRDLNRETAQLSEHGILYDGKIDPWTSFPIVSEVLAHQTISTGTWIYEIATAKERAANQRETAFFGPWVSDLKEQIFNEKQGSFQGHHIIDAEKSPNGQWVAYRYDMFDPARAKAFQMNLFSKPVRGGKPVKLGSDPYVSQYWWSRDSKGIYFTQVASDGHTAKLTFVPREGGTPQLLFPRGGNSDYFGTLSLDASGKYAACVSENNTTPPHIVVINLTTGSVRTLVDLNPAFRNIELSRPSRMEGTNQYGDTWFAHLIPPIGYKSGKRYPLIVTTYRSGDYFLRGASGNENPLQVYAADGFAVLSFDIGDVPNNRPGDFQTKLLTWASPTASIKMAIDRLVGQGLVDPQRIGISGYSHGDEIVAYALTHTNIFHAASGAEGYDPYFYSMSGEVWQNIFASWGLGGWPEEAAVKQRWEELAPSLRADRIHAALLNNVSDSEYIAFLALQTSLQQLGKPAEMVIYPNELHVINQPKHSYEIYESNVDWFRFWLQGYEDPHPVKDTQYRRWEALRKLQETARMHT